MRRLLVVVTGVLLAFIAGIVFGAGALLAAGASLSGPRALAALHAAILAGAAGPGQAAGLLIADAWTAGLLLYLLPVSVAALVGEVVGARSWLWAAGVTAALTALVPAVAGFGAGLPDAPVPGGHALALLILLGTLAGSTYWAVAGRKATMFRPWG